jgi:hypothetical protein
MRTYMESKSNHYRIAAQIEKDREEEGQASSGAMCSKTTMAIQS